MVWGFFNKKLLKIHFWISLRCFKVETNFKYFHNFSGWSTSFVLVDSQTTKAFYYKQLLTRQHFEVQQLLNLQTQQWNNKEQDAEFYIRHSFNWEFGVHPNFDI